MTVGARSRDARGDRPPGHPSSSPASLRSLSSALHPPSQLPPPPATIPANFRPAFLGFGRSRTGSRSVSSPAVDRSVARPARRLAHVPAAEPFIAPTLRLPARQGSEHLVLDHPSAAACDAINAALKDWRSRGCPATAPCRDGILRSSASFIARPASRPPRFVSFVMPAPRIQGRPTPPSPTFQAASIRPSSTAGRGSGRTPLEPGWTLVKSRRALRVERLSARKDDTEFLHRPSLPRRRGNPLHRQGFPAYRRPFARPASSRDSSIRRCRRCRARDHRTIACRDPVVCDNCGRSGHWARDCRPRRDYGPPTPEPRHRPTPTSTLKQPPLSTPSATASTMFPHAHRAPAAPNLTPRVSPSPRVPPAPPSTPGSCHLSRRGIRDGRDRCLWPARGCDDRELRRHRRHVTGSHNRGDRHDARPRDRSPDGHRRQLAVLPPTFIAKLPVLRSIIVRAPDPEELTTEVDNAAETTVVLLPVAPRVLPACLPRQRAAPVSMLRSFADVLMARPQMDVCFSTATRVVLANERCYKVSVDGALSEENERAGLGLLLLQREDDDRDETELEVHMHLSPAVTGEVRHEVVDEAPAQVRHAPIPAERIVAATPDDPPAALVSMVGGGGDALRDGGFSSEDDEDEDEDGKMEQLLSCLAELDQQVLLLDGEEVQISPWRHDATMLAASHEAPLLSPGDAPSEGGHPSVDGLTMVLISPGDALCDGGFSSEDDEDEEMEQLLPCLADLDQQELLLDGEEVGDWVRREFQPVADVFDADAEAAMIGNLLAADTDDNADDDVAADAGGTAPSSGTVIRCVADLFSRPAVPLLPTPTPPMPCAPAALPAPDRRSSRLATKPQLPAVDKAQYVLHKKMGLDFGDMPLVKATKEFANICKSRPFSASAIDGLNTLFRLKLSSMTALDEALIGLAGPGGCDFPPPAALDVSV